MRNGNVCPACHRPLPKPRAVPLVRTARDLKSMSVAQVFAYYKATAHVEDVRFALRAGVRLSPELEDAWTALLEDAEGGLAAAQCRARLAALLDDWRRERLAEDCAAAATRAPDLFGDVVLPEKRDAG